METPLVELFHYFSTLAVSISSDKVKLLQAHAKHRPSLYSYLHKLFNVNFNVATTIIQEDLKRTALRQLKSKLNYY